MLEQAVVCPRCKEHLFESGETLCCQSCEATYGSIENVPVLLPDRLSRQQEVQTRYFDAQFARYDDHYEPESWRLSYIRRIFRALGVRAGRGPYLDVGAGGSGATVIEAARLGIEATGCDLSVPGMIHSHRTATAQGVGALTRFVVCTAESLPFPDAAFGCASAVAILEHLDDDAAAAAELARVVRPGGVVWITVPLAYRYVLPPLWPVYALHDRRLGHLRHYDEAGLVGLAGHAGLRHLETTYTGHAVKLVQLFLDRVLPLRPTTRTRVWWTLERLDLRAQSRPRGALQLHAVFQRL